jgi:hypothetical protein
MKNINAAVLHINSASEKATSPTMRIARYVAQRLDVPLIHSIETAAKYADTKFELLFVKLGVLKFSSHREDALKIYGNAGRIINLENDYSFKPDPRLKKMQPEWQVWGTVPANVRAHGGAYVNWNCLTWLYPRPWADRLRAVRPTPGRMLYYGAFRPDRVGSFSYWFKDSPYDVVVGARSTHVKKFEAVDPKIRVENFRTPQALADLSATAIYLEDATSHDLYCSLANRFFECLQLGIPMLLDNRCEKTFRAAKLPGWEDFTVSTPKEAAKLLADPERIAVAQRKLWYKDFDAALATQMNRAVASL